MSLDVAVRRPEQAEAHGSLVVSARRRLTEDVVALELRHPHGDPLPPWAPGAHVELRLPAPEGELRRQYSLCGRPEDSDAWLVAVLREPAGRGGSAYVHDQLPQGATVDFAGPRNHFQLRPAGRYLFISGGIGITPILPMVRQATADGADWSLVHCARSADRVAFGDELGALPSDRVTVHLDDRDGLHDLDRLTGRLDATTEVYVCGPAGLIEAVERRAEAAPWHCCSEQFAQAAGAGPTENAAVEVVIASTGASHLVPPTTSILEALNDAGLGLPYSCAEGECGTCEVGVLDGVPDHRDIVLSREEKAANDCMMICVSRASSPRLVLDL